mmetsp:Transcript_29723/g.41045  ORF Transcript_29723/g.41045 Transcript_29723/m.41045 type:complete len:182 (-) Transcript_29723:36-581(-)
MLAKDAQEVQARASRRLQKMQKERSMKRKEEKEARFAEKNRFGPSASELDQMPALQAPSQIEANLENFHLDDAVSLVGGDSLADQATSPPSAGASFARVAEMGYASGYNAPFLSPSLNPSQKGPSSSFSPIPSWGSKGSWGQASTSSPSPDQPSEELPKSRKGNKGKQKLIMFTTSQRGRS